jgi:hypothetical protein
MEVPQQVDLGAEVDLELEALRLVRQERLAKAMRAVIHRAQAAIIHLLAAVERVLRVYLRLRPHLLVETEALGLCLLLLGQIHITRVEAEAEVLAHLKAVAELVVVAMEQSITHKQT